MARRQRDATGPRKRIRTQYDARCARCRKRLPAGESVWYQGGNKRGRCVRCLECGRHPDPPGTPKYQARPEAAADTPPRKADEPRPPQPRRDGKPPTPVAPSDARPQPLDRKTPEGHVRILYESPGEMIRRSLHDTDAVPGADPARINDQFWSEAGPPSFFNGYTEETMLAAIADPPAKLTARVDEMRQAIETECGITSKRPRRKMRRRLVEGEALDPDLVLVRSSEPWEKMQREPRPGRGILRVAVNCTCNYTQENSDLVYRGAAAVAATDYLESIGYRVELVGYSVVEHPTDKVGRFACEVTIKQPDQPLDIAAAALALSDIGFYRMVMLRAPFREIPGTIQYGWGKCRNAPASMAKAADVLIDYSMTTKQQAIDAVRAAISKHGPSAIEAA